MAKHLALIVAMLFIPALLAGSAKADQTWQYSGNSNSFDPVGVPLPPSSNPCGCALDGTITFNTPMLGQTETGANVVSYSFTDGAYTFDNTNSTLGFSGYTAGSQPYFEAWTLSVTTLSGVTAFYSQSYDHGESSDTGLGGLSERGNPGTWTEVAPVATPEPNTLILLGAGITALVLAIHARGNRSTLQPCAQPQP